jgi:hypothetical protein
MRLAILVSLLLTACAGAPLLDNIDGGVMLEFAPSVDSATHLRAFASVDSFHLVTSPSRVSIKPGNRTIGYFCAVYMDGPPPPTITKGFKAGKRYVFHCKDDVLVEVEEK